MKGLYVLSQGQRPPPSPLGAVCTLDTGDGTSVETADTRKGFSRNPTGSTEMAKSSHEDKVTKTQIRSCLPKCSQPSVRSLGTQVSP